MERLEWGNTLPDHAILLLQQIEQITQPLPWQLAIFELKDMAESITSADLKKYLFYLLDKLLPPFTCFYGLVDKLPSGVDKGHPIITKLDNQRYEIRNLREIFIDLPAEINKTLIKLTKIYDKTIARLIKIEPNNQVLFPPVVTILGVDYVTHEQSLHGEITPTLAQAIACMTPFGETLSGLAHDHAVNQLGPI